MACNLLRILFYTLNYNTDWCIFCRKKSNKLDLEASERKFMRKIRPIYYQDLNSDSKTVTHYTVIAWSLLCWFILAHCLNFYTSKWPHCLVLVTKSAHPTHISCVIVVELMRYFRHDDEYWKRWCSYFWPCFNFLMFNIVL